MKKSVFSLLMAAALFAVLCLPALAADYNYIADDTGVFSEEEVQSLNAMAEAIAAQYHFNPCFVLTEDSTAYQGCDSLGDLLKRVYTGRFGSTDGMAMGVDHAASVWNAYCAGNSSRYFTDDDIDRVWADYAAAETHYQGVADYLTAVESLLGEKSGAKPTTELTDVVMEQSRLNDMAGLLSDSQRNVLLSKLNDVSQRLQFDVAAVTTNTLGGKHYVDYADDYFDYNGFGFGENYDGALLLISMEPDNRHCYISTCGSGLKILTDSRIDRMLDVIVDEHLVNGEYYEAIDSFADLCEKYVVEENTPTPFLERLAGWLGSGLLLGLIVAFIRMAMMKSGMKSVRMQRAADSYVAGNVDVTRATDVFLYSTVSRVKREKTSSSGGSSSHRSSSGRSHGGGGRSF